jgi:hypothetical protein
MGTSPTTKKPFGQKTDKICQAKKKQTTLEWNSVAMIFRSILLYDWWRSFIGIFSQIWLQAKHESKHLKTSFYIFGYPI